jgi:hypothetical protein
MVCGSLNEIDQGGGGDIQPLSGSAMAPRTSYHNEKARYRSPLNCVSIRDFERRDWNAVIGMPRLKGYFHFWDLEKCSGPRVLEIST